MKKCYNIHNYETKGDILMNILTETAAANNIWYDIVLIGLGILSTLIGGIVMKLLETKFNKIGKIAIYYRIIQFDRVSKDVVTFRIQIKNPSRDVKFLRDLCFCEICKDNKNKAVQAEKMRVTNKGEIKEEKTYANNGSYSIAADPRSLIEYELRFIFNKTVDPNNKFILSYIDDNEQIQTIKVNLETNLEWIVANIKKGDN